MYRLKIDSHNDPSFEPIRTPLIVMIVNFFVLNTAIPVNNVFKLLTIVGIRFFETTIALFWERFRSLWRIWTL